MDIIKYAVECDSLYNVVAFFMICTLLGFVAWLLYKAVLALCGLIRYIVNKVTKYKDIHAKARCKDASLEVDLHEQNKVGTALLSPYFILLFLLCVSFKLTVHTKPTVILLTMCYLIG